MAGRIKTADVASTGEDERDENGLTPWHYGPGGRQLLCGTCNCRPCAAGCAEQWMPDRPEWKAARAGVLPPTAYRLPPGERRIPVEAAMAQAMAVVAGEVRADELAPPGGAAVVAEAGTPT